MKSSKKVRVIAGKLKNSNIFFKPNQNNQALRPSLDRHRERLFAWLHPYLSGSRVLDLFSGSGILAIEAYSRGASEVTIVEKDKATYQSIMDNLTRLKINKITTINQDAKIAIHLMEKNNQSFNLIFLDPPFEKNNEIEKTLGFNTFKSVIKKNILKSGGFVYLEISSQIKINEGGGKTELNDIAKVFLGLDKNLVLYKSKEFKNLALLLFQKSK